MKTTTQKRQGIHYTPPELAEFLARRLTRQLAGRTDGLRVLDPACGNGALLAAFARAVPTSARQRLSLVGYETDLTAIEEAEHQLGDLPVRSLTLKAGDFLTADDVVEGKFDAVIANPPYVRTQVLGALRAGRLAEQFGLTGRVDLYYAFARAMADRLRPGGGLGLLVSNRFLTIRSGAALRSLLRSQFKLEAIYDLGDTKLFSAAVLPAIIIATKNKAAASAPCRFDRVYAQPAASRRSTPAVSSVLAALADGETAGLVRAPSGVFHIERGCLAKSEPNGIWTLSSGESDAWLKTVERHTGPRFGDVGRVRVGIKTTADEVFIRDEWKSLPAASRPEPKLLRVLLRHFSAARWLAGARRQTVLYPHAMLDGRRQAVDLAAFPRAEKYLTAHRQRLSRRTYVAESGRQWYEIWVPHDPSQWSAPKIVFPDIAADARFFLDRSGAVVNGDCYWITLRDAWAEDWLLLMLAVANSSFIARYYDVAFHNQLYSGRRRFMTQYVKLFPLPRLESKPAQAAIRRVRQLVIEPTEQNDAAPADPAIEREIDELVWRAFGLVAPTRN